MKPFMNEDFLLETETGKKLYNEHAKNMPIFDFHNHLNIKEIYEDRQFSDLGELWLGGDHYKWRAMRADGIEENFITGQASWEEKYEKWTQVLPHTFGNPLYHWTHLELQRYFGIDKPLTLETGKEIYASCNELIGKKEYSVRGLLGSMNVKAMCTTDDPSDDLKYHKALKEEGYEVKVLPSFRPDKALAVDKPDFADYMKLLGKSTGCIITSVDDLKKALKERLSYFCQVGCRVSDHSLDENLYIPADDSQVEEIFQKGLRGEVICNVDICKYKGAVLTFLGKAYHEAGIVMQLHMGVIRNNSGRMYEKLGPDTGFDSIGSIPVPSQLSGLLNAMDLKGELPKTIFYCLSSSDFEYLAAMAGNFQDSSTKGKMQLGASWWFLDQKRGMEAQLDVLSQIGLLVNFVGMLTDSRSFLSFPRHEYFRRILCNYIGNIVERGEYPEDMTYLGELVENICYGNAVRYFGI